MLVTMSQNFDLKCHDISQPRICQWKYFRFTDIVISYWVMRWLNVRNTFLQCLQIYRRVAAPSFLDSMPKELSLYFQSICIYAKYYVNWESESLVFKIRYNAIVELYSGLNNCSKILAVSRFQSYYPQTCQTQCCKVLSSETQVHSICLKNFFFSKSALWLQDKTQVPARVQTLHSTHSAFSFCSISHYSPCGSLCSNNPKPQRISFPRIPCICLSCSYPRTICDFPPSSSFLSFKAQLRHRCILKSFLTF